MTDGVCENFRYDEAGAGSGEVVRRITRSRYNGSRRDFIAHIFEEGESLSSTSVTHRLYRPTRRTCGRLLPMIGVLITNTDRLKELTSRVLRSLDQRGETITSL